MEKLEVAGVVHFIGEEETFGANGFRKRVLVLQREADTQYPQYVPFEFTQNNCDKLDGLQVGSIATVSYNLRGREHNGKYYSSLQGWKIDVAEMTGAPAPIAPAPIAPSAPVAPPAPAAKKAPKKKAPEPKIDEDEGEDPPF